VAALFPRRKKRPPSMGPFHPCLDRLAPPLWASCGGPFSLFSFWCHERIFLGSVFSPSMWVHAPRRDRSVLPVKYCCANFSPLFCPFCSGAFLERNPPANGLFSVLLCESVLQGFPVVLMGVSKLPSLRFFLHLCLFDLRLFLTAAQHFRWCKKFFLAAIDDPVRVKFSFFFPFP